MRGPREQPLAIITPGAAPKTGESEREIERERGEAGILYL